MDPPSVQSGCERWLTGVTAVQWAWCLPDLTTSSSKRWGTIHSNGQLLQLAADYKKLNLGACELLTVKLQAALTYGTACPRALTMCDQRILGLPAAVGGHKLCKEALQCVLTELQNTPTQLSACCNANDSARCTCLQRGETAHNRHCLDVDSVE